MNKIARSIRTNADLYKTAFVIGLTGYGGLASLGQIKKEYVHKHHIVSEHTFLNAVSLSQILPGSSIINLIALFSYLRAGLIGAIIGTAVYILPTFIITTFFSALYFADTSLPQLSTVVRGLNLLLLPLLMTTFIQIGFPLLVRGTSIRFRNLFISGLCFFLYLTAGVNAIHLILLSGILGVILYSFGGMLEESQEELEVVSGTLFQRKKAWILLLLGIVLLSVLIYDLSVPLWMLFSSFFKIGLVSFGGGIAAIPLMEGAFVRTLHWVTPSQFWDGIAISQITPGPIFIASAFFGYRIGGIWGALLATTGMLIPSMLLIIIAEKIHARIKQFIVVRMLTRGFLVGFVGILAALIIGQGVRIGIGMFEGILVMVCLYLMKKNRFGFFASLVLCIAYSFVFRPH